MKHIQSAEETSTPIINNTASDSHADVAMSLTYMRNSNDSDTPRTDDNVGESAEAANDNSNNDQDTTANENMPKGVRQKKSNDLKKKHM